MELQGLLNSVFDEPNRALRLSGTSVPLSPTTPADLQTPPQSAPYNPSRFAAGFAHTNYRSALGSGRGAVVTLRFDDAPSSDYSSVFSLLTARGLVGGFAVPSSFLGAGGRLTIAQMLEMDNAGMEIMCHSATHGVDPASLSSFADETSGAVTSLHTLARSVANAKSVNQDICIDSFVQPGTWVSSPTDCVSHEALESQQWRWVQSHFGGSEAYIPEAQVSRLSGPTANTLQGGGFPLPAAHHHGAGATIAACPGSPPSGYANWSLCLQAAIDQIVAYGGCLEILVHSSSLDGVGNMTTAQFTTVLDYIQTQRDLGLIDVMTPTASRFATPDTHRFNLLSDAEFRLSATGAYNGAWLATGSPAITAGAGQSGGAAIDVNLNNYVRQLIPMGPCSDPQCRTVMIEGFHKNTAGGSNGSPHLILRFTGSSQIVSRDLTPAAGDNWARFRTYARAPRLPGVDTVMYLDVWIFSDSAANSTRISDLRVVKV